MSGKRQWKKVEQRHAELHGALHVKSAFPAMVRMGSMHGKNYPDSIDDFLAIESKSGDDLIPKWLRDSVDQAIRNERAFSLDGDGKQRMPVTILHQNKDFYDEDIVLIRDDIFRALVLPAIHALHKVMEMSWDADRLR